MKGVIAVWKVVILRFKTHFRTVFENKTDILDPYVGLEGR